jgi:hypothetical protein
MGLIPGRAGTTPIYWNMVTGDPDAIGQGTWTKVVDVSFWYNVLFRNTTHNDGDNFSVDFRCPAGTYTIGFNAEKAINRGIVDVYIDAVEVGSVDLYNGSTVMNYRAAITGISIAEGAHTLKLQVDGKNASSSDHYFSTSGINLQRTA